MISTTIKKQAEKQGISSTLYDPKIYVDNGRFIQKVKKFKLHIMNIYKRIGFGHCIPNETVEYVNKKYEDFPLGSPISFHLEPIEDNFHILSNINKSIDNSIIKSSVSGSACNLPFEFLKLENILVLKEWAFSKEGEEFLQQLQIHNCESLSVKKRTISQSECQEWLEQRKYRITSNNAHKVLIHQKNFETLTENLFLKSKKSSNKTQEALNHGTKFEPSASQIYNNVMKFKWKHYVSVRETGIVIQLLLYWLAASPDGLVTDESATPIFGLIEIKYPLSKRSLRP